MIQHRDDIEITTYYAPIRLGMGSPIMIRATHVLTGQYVECNTERSVWSNSVKARNQLIKNLNQGVKMKQPHKHAEAIKAWADGAEIEYSTDGVHWYPAPGPGWSENSQYRVKPEKEYPKSTLTDHQLVQTYHNNFHGNGPTAMVDALRGVADEALKRYVDEQEKNNA